MSPENGQKREREEKESAVNQNSLADNGFLEIASRLRQRIRVRRKRGRKIRKVVSIMAASAAAAVAADDDDDADGPIIIIIIKVQLNCTQNCH